MRLAGKHVKDLAVNANTVVPTVVLDNGALLSGIIKSFDNIVQVNSDIDVYRQATGEIVPSFADNTSGTGAYAVVVPLDNLEVVFHPPTYTVPLASEVHSNFLVTADTTLNGFLPACPAPNNYGTGLAGTGGFVPHLAATGGTNRVGNPNFGVQITNGRGAATTILVVSGQSRSVPFLGGTLLVNLSPSFSVKIPTVLGGASGVGGAGAKFVPAGLPASLAGLDAYCQAAVRDIAAVKGWALSDGLHFQVCP
jgi:sRNA-binding regulator protein Hfq